MSEQQQKKVLAIIVSLASEKGGVGKTTLTAIFLTMLSMLGYRVLGVDMDPQGQLGLLFAYHRNTLVKGIYHILTKFAPDVLRGEKAPVRQVLKKTFYDTATGKIFDPRKPDSDGLDVVLRKVYSREQIDLIVQEACQGLLDGIALEPNPQITSEVQENGEDDEEKYHASHVWYGIKEHINNAVKWAEGQAYEEDETRQYVDSLIREETNNHFTLDTWNATQARIDAATWEIQQERLQTSSRGPDLLPITADAGDADRELVGKHQYWGELLLHALHPLRSQYDYIFIDCPPSIQALTVNALNASNYVCIPLTPETLNLEGMLGLLSVIDQAQRRANTLLKTAGLILNKVQVNWKIHQQGARDLRNWGGRERVFKTEIKQNAPVVTSIDNQSLIVLDQQDSEYARAYWLLLNELLEVIGGPAAQEVAEIAGDIREVEKRRLATLEYKKQTKRTKKKEVPTEDSTTSK